MREYNVMPITSPHFQQLSRSITRTPRTLTRPRFGIHIISILQLMWMVSQWKGMKDILTPSAWVARHFCIVFGYSLSALIMHHQERIVQICAGHIVFNVVHREIVHFHVTVYVGRHVGVQSSQRCCGNVKFHQNSRRNQQISRGMESSPLRNENVLVITIIYSSFVWSTCFSLSFILIRGMADALKKRKIYRIREERFNLPQSKQPPLWPLSFSIISDVVLFISMIWLFIKLNLLSEPVSTYCTSQYPQWMDNIKVNCEDDIWCKYNETEIHFNYTHTHTQGECIGDFIGLGSVASWLFLWFGFTALILSQPVYVLSACKYGFCGWLCTAKHHSFSGFLTFWDCTKLTVYRKVKNKQKIYWSVYVKRTLWCNRHECKSITLWIVVQCTRIMLPLWGLSMIAIPMMGIQGSDYTIKWFELFPLLVVYPTKLLIEIWYSFGPKANRVAECKLEIMHILMDRFDLDICSVMMLYLPRLNKYHKEETCREFSEIQCCVKDVSEY